MICSRSFNELSKAEDCVMLFGHNPEFAALAHLLSNTITDNVYGQGL